MHVPSLKEISPLVGLSVRQQPCHKIGGGLVWSLQEEREVRTETGATHTTLSSEITASEP